MDRQRHRHTETQTHIDSRSHRGPQTHSHPVSLSQTPQESHCVHNLSEHLGICAQVVDSWACTHMSTCPLSQVDTLTLTSPHDTRRTRSVVSRVFVPCRCAHTATLAHSTRHLQPQKHELRQSPSHTATAHMCGTHTHAQKQEHICLAMGWREGLFLNPVHALHWDGVGLPLSPLLLCPPTSLVLMAQPG